MFCRLVYIINHVFIPFQTRYTFRLLGWASSRDTDHMIEKPSPNSGGFGETTGNICGRTAALLVSVHITVLFFTLCNFFSKSAQVYFSAPCHEEITIHIILMRKELKGVSTGELF